MLQYQPIPRTAEELPAYLEYVLPQIDALFKNLTTPRWDDLRFPAVSLKPGGTAPTWNDTYGYYQFAVGDYVWAHAQLPHSWKVGTALVPHVHWAKTTSVSGYVKWQIDWTVANIGDILASGGPLAEDVPVVPTNDTLHTHALTSLGEIDASALTISSMLLIKLSRVAATTGADYGATRAALFEFDIHYQLDGFGSQREYVKL